MQTDLIGLTGLTEDEDDEDDFGWDTESKGVEYESSSDDYYGAVGCRKQSEKRLYPPPYPHFLPPEPRYMRGLFLVTHATQHSPRRVAPSPLHVATFMFRWIRRYARLAAARMYVVARKALGMDPAELD